MARRLASAALVATVAALPFELRATLPAGPVRLSSVELFLYATLALWAVSRVAAPRPSWRALALRDLRRWPPPLAAAAGLALVLLLSAACAPMYRGAALKFTLRSWGGILLGVAAADLLRARATLRWALIALVGGATAAALAAVAEARLPSLAPWLRPFHEQTFQALGQPRGSGPFQFPNIAAMALEAAVPLALALAATATAGPVPGTAAAGVLLAGVASTGSRAGLAGAALATVAMAACWRSDGFGRRAGRIAAAVGALAAISTLAASGSLPARLHFWNESRWYRARISPAGAAADRLPAALAANGAGSELLVIQNAGTLGWRHLPPSRVVLSHHWLDAGTGRVVVRDGVTTPLPADVPPGGAVTVRAAVRAPAQPGRYVLAWDMVQEDVRWFGPGGDEGWREPVVVGDGAGAAAVAGGRLPAERPTRVELWRAALAAFRTRPLLGVGPDNFRRVYAGYLPAAGAGHEIDDRLHANSLYFETLADLGLLGAAAAAALILALAGAARRAIQSAGQ
ncbi:MAG TPA: O-antigen ligase family protein, partial [Polyangia bacterium]|nr:O-antigen ligase family protein [Polyangia bacterium]